MDGMKFSHQPSRAAQQPSHQKNGNLIKISHLPISTIFAPSKVHLVLGEKIQDNPSF